MALNSLGWHSTPWSAATCRRFGFVIQDLPGTRKLRIANLKGTERNCGFRIADCELRIANLKTSSGTPFPLPPSPLPPSTFPTPHSPLHIPHSTFHIPHSAFDISALHIPHSPFRIPPSPFPFKRSDFPQVLILHSGNFRTILLSKVQAILSNRLWTKRRNRGGLPLQTFRLLVERPCASS
jgi:hypothetical protein